MAFEKDQVVSERNPKEIGWLSEKYISKIQTIEKAKTYPTKPSVLCSWCEYLSLCLDGQQAVANRKKKQENKEVLKGTTPPSSITETPVKTSSLDEKTKNDLMPLSSNTISANNTFKSRGRKNSHSMVSSDQLSLF